jgi:hypothetical protein
VNIGKIHKVKHVLRTRHKFGLLLFFMKRSPFLPIKFLYVIKFWFNLALSPFGPVK